MPRAFRTESAQRDGLHHPPVRRPQRPRARAPPPRRHPEEWQARLRARPRQPATLAELQQLLDAFAGIYNEQRPHRSLAGRATPADACAARPKAGPGDRSSDTHDRVPTDRIDATGLVTLRYKGKLHHTGIGRARTRVLLLVQDLHIRVISAETGELIRELTLDPDRDYQPPGRLPG